MVRSGRAGHKILCREMDDIVSWAMPAYKALSKAEQQTCNVKYMPYTLDEKKASDRDRAKVRGMSLREFHDQYHNAAKKVKKFIQRA